MKAGTKLLLLVILLAISPRLFSQAKQIRYADLVSRLTDLKALAVSPEPGEKSAMWSSYDRRSKVNANGKFIFWDANDDGLNPQYIRKEGKNMVLAEMEGPGVIVRMWSASPGKGYVKIYLDGQPTPVLDLPFIQYFDTTATPAFGYSQLVYETKARGFNNYVPITYQKSCKIVAEPEWGQYYHFNYITFPKDTKVEAFNPKPSPDNKAALATANRFFASRLGELPYPVKATETKEVVETIPAGGAKTITISGPKAIHTLRAQLQVENKSRLDEALRKLTLQINWDDEKEAAVWSPIGDFFGSAPGYNLYRTLPMGMTKEAMYSYWYMPFQQSATITLTNNFDQPVTVNLVIGLEKLSGTGQNMSRFHAKWHRNLAPPADTARWPDWTVLETAGKGRFLGMSLLVWNPKGGSNKQYGGEGSWWWGEGDEKFFVDGEKFPSTFGTGTEDYFGYAWCMPDYFTRAFHSQNHTEGNMGYQSLNRWQVIDNVPFQTSFKGYLEKYFPDKWPTQYAVTTYWYLDKGGKDPIQSTPVAELYGYETPFEAYRVPGVIEGENMKVEKNTGGWENTDWFVDERLFDQVSGHKVLIWNGEPKKENKLAASFHIQKPGKYKLVMQVVRSPEGGRFQTAVNGQPVKQELNFKSDVKPGKAEPIELGTFELKPGKQVLEFKWLPTEGYGQNMMIDFVNLEAI
ncbi:glycoside hydrolase family 172 protein [Pontibacter liquoris]|uniref:glycoside hydrolase family 172 protein n=1 Tax=Pontibacter liquoris TaxID=2905677 RepID=UPI001FA7BB78|nr:glycoside hydrolase family 172 protein [Pontibacter liquoris]